MELSLNKLPWHLQLAAVAAIACAACGAFWSLYAQPAQQDIDARRAQLSALQAEVDRGMAVAKRLPEFRREIGGLEAQLNRLRAVLPEDKDVADLLRRIQAMATESRLTIRGFTPQAVATKQVYTEWPIGLQVEGSYHNLGDFLERISKFPRIINVTAIKISSKDQQTESSTISAECTATTFVMAEPKSGSAGRAAPGAQARSATE